MSTRQEVGIINVKYHCNKATRKLNNVTQTPAWLKQLSYPVDSKLYSDFCIARDCFMILMFRSLQFNALSRGNQRPNLSYKKACRGIFGGFSVHQLLPEALPFVTGIDISLTTICMDKKNQLDVTFCILYFSSNSCSTCFGQPCAHHQELTTA